MGLPHLEGDTEQWPQWEQGAKMQREPCSSPAWGEEKKQEVRILVANQGSSALYFMPTLPPGICPGPCQGGSLCTACSDLLGYRASLTPSHMHEAGANTSWLAEIPWLDPQFWGWQCRHGKREARSSHARGNPWIRPRDNRILAVYNVMLCAKRCRKPWHLSHLGACPFLEHLWL